MVWGRVTFCRPTHITFKEVNEFQCCILGPKSVTFFGLKAKSLVNHVFKEVSILHSGGLNLAKTFSQSSFLGWWGVGVELS
jgi:hypothetical protein